MHPSETLCIYFSTILHLFFSPSLLDSIASIQETFTPNKYLLGIFSSSVPRSILPSVTFSNGGLCFHFIPADFSLI